MFTSLYKRIFRNYFREKAKTNMFSTLSLGFWSLGEFRDQE